MEGYTATVPQIARRGCGWLMNSTRGMKGKYGFER